MTIKYRNNRTLKWMERLGQDSFVKQAHWKTANDLSWQKIIWISVRAQNSLSKHKASTAWDQGSK